ncbi:MAG: cupredoxin family copper-binding protein [Patescibacteria group bacterium]|nr:cupredoxin family copper-binding protein [Patescibacteria group bacterium]
MKNLWIIILVIVLIVLGYLGYKYLYKSKYSSTPTTVTSVGSNTISIKNFSFNPSELTVTKGTEVTFINNDSTTHTVTFADFKSSDLKPGDNFKHTFDTTGTFDFHCSIHPQMKGKIIVQ